MFIDLVIVQFPVDKNKYLYEAPAFTHLAQGDEVLVYDTDQNGIVLDSCTFTVGDDKYNFVCKAFSALKPLYKIKSIVTYKDIHWEATE